MRLIFCLVLLSGSTALMAQQDVTSKRDSDLAALMNRAENRAPKKIKFINKLKLDSELQKEVLAEVIRYWKALGSDNLGESYAMMSDAYRKAIRFITYVKIKRIGINEVTIENMDMVGETCARVRGTMWGNVGAPIGMMRVPMAVHIFKEGDEWHVYQNPYNQGGFKLPMADTIKLPCIFKNKK